MSIGSEEVNTLQHATPTVSRDALFKGFRRRTEKANWFTEAAYRVSQRDLEIWADSNPKRFMPG